MPQRPAVLEGEQYELWEGDDQPWGTELVRQQAPLIRVTCKLCESITYVAPDRIGTTIVCTDCGQQLKVEATATIPEVETGLVASGEEYQLDEDSWSGSLEPSTVGPVYERLYQATPDERNRQISLVATDRRSRPKIPPQPLLTGYRSFLVGPGILARWFTLSLFSAIAAGLTQLAVSIAFSGLATIAALFFLLCAFVMAALMFGAASSCAIAILSESSEGNAHIHDWPTTNPADWLMDTVVILLALGGAGLPGGGLAYLFDAPPLVAITMSLLSVWLFFPVTLLSSLEGSSPFSLLMPGVTGSLFRFAPWWFQFYILSLLLITSIGGGLLVAGWFSTTAFIAGLPVAWIAWAVYFRMLGRLAWKIREG